MVNSIFTPMLQAMGNGKGEDSCSHNKAVNESSQSYGSASGLTRSHRKAQTARSGPWGLSETQRPWMWLIWEVQWQWGAAMTSRSSKDFQESVCVRIHTHTHTPGEKQGWKIHWGATTEKKGPEGLESRRGSMAPGGKYSTERMGFWL